MHICRIILYPWRPFAFLAMLPHCKPQKLNVTYSAQSTAIINVMSSVGSPTEVRTMTIVTRPACGIPAAPMLAAVAVILEQRKKGISFTSDELLCKKPHHVSTGAFLNHNPLYTSHCTEVPAFCGQKPGQRARTGQTVCPALNSHPCSLGAGGAVLLSLNITRAEKEGQPGCAFLSSVISLWVMASRSTVCHGPASTPHRCFPLAAELPADISESPSAAPVPGESTAGCSQGLSCQSLTKRLGQG